MSPFIVNYTFIFLFHTAFGHVLSEMYKERLNNYSIYEITAFNTRERAVLYTLQVRVDDMAFLNGITNEAAIQMDVLVKKSCTNEFESLMRANDIEYVGTPSKYLIKKIDDIAATHDVQFQKKRLDLTSGFYCYDILKIWLQEKLKKHSNLKEIKIGRTYEKRDISVYRLSTGKKNKAVFLMAGEEGRDWSSPAILLNFMNYVLERKYNLEILTRHYDFYILPIFNPDGYTYSMTKERLWSVNCRVYIPKKACSENASLMGISVDRNWYFNKLTVRNDECDPLFAGSKPLSEEETIAVSDFLNNIALNMMAFVNIRGFENLVTIPYSYEKAQCNNYDVLMDMLSAVHDAVILQHNTSFGYGLGSKYLYNFTGNVADWVKKHLNTPIVYTFYMKVEPYVLPSAKDILPLTAQLSTMIKEVLLLANTFYGPLFNNQIKLNIDVTSLLIIVSYYLYCVIFKLIK